MLFISIDLLILLLLFLYKLKHRKQQQNYRYNFSVHKNKIRLLDNKVEWKKNENYSYLYVTDLRMTTVQFVVDELKRISSDARIVYITCDFHTRPSLQILIELDLGKEISTYFNTGSSPCTINLNVNFFKKLGAEMMVREIIEHESTTS